MRRMIAEDDAEWADNTETSEPAASSKDPAVKRKRKTPPMRGTVAQVGGLSSSALASACEEEDPVDPSPRPAVKKPKGTKPEDLDVGTVVLYWDGWRGVVRDAFQPIDEFWVADEESGEIVRDDGGEIVHFKSEELKLVAPPPVLPPPLENGCARGGVLLLGVEAHMLKMLEHFGTPGTQARQNPQQLLAIPSHMCAPDQIHIVGSEGVEDTVVELAEKLRPDIHVAVRGFHLKHALQSLMPGVTELEKYFVLSAVQIPFGLAAINSAEDKRNRRLRKDVWNQIDLCVTATGEFADEESSQSAARRALGETCGIEISEKLWTDSLQNALRKRLGVTMPLKFTDESEMEIMAIVLPEDAVITEVKGVICFSEAPASGRAADSAAATELHPRSGDGHADVQLGEKTVAEWEQEQQQFAGQPALPPGWIRVKSRQTDQVYYFNKKTQQSTFDAPLPVGWTKQVSKSTGQTYYFNAKKGISQFDVPKE